MAGEMLCPDCGGVVGATETTSAGTPCSCFAGASSKEDTAIDLPGISAPPQPKICALCGKDVSGHRRVKDSRGYVCYDCAKAEQLKERGGRVRCRSCGRLAKQETMVKTESGSKICSRCNAEQIKARKQELRKLGIADARNRFEKSRLLIFVAIAILLLGVIMLSWLRLLPR